MLMQVAWNRATSPRWAGGSSHRPPSRRALHPGDPLRELGRRENKIFNASSSFWTRGAARRSNSNVVGSAARRRCACAYVLFPWPVVKWSLRTHACRDAVSLRLMCERDDAVSVVEHACLGPSRDSGLPVRGSPGAPGCHAFLCALPSSGA